MVTKAGLNNAVSKKICAAGLCPDEFSYAHIFELQDKGDSLLELKRALALDPASPARWADAGQAFSALHRVEEARYCFEKAVERGPHKPEIRFRAANFYFGIEDSKGTMRNLFVILSDPALQSEYPTVFLTYSRMGVPVQKILSEGVPITRVAGQSYLRYLMQDKRVADAATAWDWAVRKDLVDSALTGQYAWFLLGNGQEKRAEEVWAASNARAAPEYRRTNWVFNGHFENAFQVSPFDWRIDPEADVQAQRVKGAIEFTFGGKENVDYYHVSQLAVLSPGKWKLRASVKTQGITTDRGVSVRVAGEGLDASTDAMKGTNDWTEGETVFDVRAEIKVVRVQVIRHLSLKFDSNIAGTAWVRSVELSPLR